LRNAFRAELDSIISTVAPPIAWVRKDTLNTSEQPDASTGYVDLEFPGGGEEQYTFGAPAANLHREEGQVTVRVVTPLRGGQVERDKAEAYAKQTAPPSVCAASRQDPEASASPPPRR
jgi:hypothetical protein